MCRFVGVSVSVPCVWARAVCLFTLRPSCFRNAVGFLVIGRCGASSRECFFPRPPTARPRVPRGTRTRPVGSMGGARQQQPGGVKLAQTPPPLVQRYLSSPLHSKVAPALWTASGIGDRERRRFGPARNGPAGPARARVRVPALASAHMCGCVTMDRSGRRTGGSAGGPGSIDAGDGIPSISGRGRGPKIILSTRP